MKLLNQSKIEKETYQVQEGDVLGTSAERHQLTFEQSIALYPNLDENSVLKIGQELIIQHDIPYITVVTIKILKAEETVEYETETIEDLAKYRGEEQVE